MAKGFTPRLHFLKAYFPGIVTPFEMKVTALSEEVDAAVVSTDLGGRKIPVLVADSGRPIAAAGQPVVLLGFPTGLDALLARLDESLAHAIVDATGGDLEKVTTELASRGLIRPLATQGHLSDVLPGRLVYDAQTTFGGSGGPILNSRGRVIGINAAILSEFAGASFGVPIKLVVSLLPTPSKATFPKTRNPVK
jgi:S1-C subfamily serine protease